MSQVFYATVFPDQSISVQTSLDAALEDYKEAERLSVEGGGETVALYVKEMETNLAIWDIELLIPKNTFEDWTRLKRRTEPARYTSTYWQHEADLPQGREGVYFLQILDPEGEEYAVIIHQTWDGMYPIGGKMANEKLERANHICEALNATL